MILIRAFATVLVFVQVFLLFFACRAQAQYFEVEHFTSGAEVIDIVRQGDYLWTAQRRGGVSQMNLTDGSMTHFNHVNSKLLTNDVTCIRVAPNGEVWVGTNFGLARFDGEDWIVYRSNNSPLSAEPKIADIVIDENSVVWIASGATLFRFDGVNSWQLFAPGNSPLPSGLMTSLAQDKDGSFWIGYDFGLGVVRFDGFNATQYTTSNSGLATGWIDNIWVDPQGNKWFASSTDPVGLSRFDGVTWSLLEPSDTTLASGYVNAMTFPSSGGMWIGSNGGVQFLDGSAWTNYDDKNSPMPGSQVMSLFLDTDIELWVGFDHGVSREIPIAVNEMAGLGKLSGSTWSFYSVGNSPLPDPWVSKVVFDHMGFPWISTYGGGVIQFDGLDWDWNHLGNSPMPGSYIYDARFDQEGSLWMAIDGYGLTRKKGDQWAVFDPSNSQFPSYWPTAMANAADSSMWFGTHGGHLVKYDGINWTTHNPNQTPLPTRAIQKMVVDTLNTVWLSYTSFLFPGLIRFSEGAYTHFTEDNSELPSNIIHDMVVDGNNQVWFGTQAGLARYNDMEWEVFTTANSPLTSSIIQRLALDDNNLLWIHTSTGIMSFDGNGKWTLFPNPVFGSDVLDRSPLHMQAGPDGQLWIGTITGLLVFDPVFPAPEIVLSVGQLLFDSVEVGNCVIRDYELFGAALDDELLVQAPGGFTLAVHPDSVFVSALILTPDNGEVAQTLFVAFCPTEEKLYSEEIMHTSAGAATGLLYVEGVGFIKTSLDPAWAGGAFKVYPNPARGWVMGEWMEPHGGSQSLDVRLITLNGQLAAQYVWPGHTAHFVVEVAHLTAGMYLLELRDRATGRQVGVQQLVIE